MIKVLTHLKKSNFIFLFVKLFYYIIFIEEVKTTICKEHEVFYKIFISNETKDDKITQSFSTNP